MTSTTAPHPDAALLEQMVRRGWYYLFRFRACLAQEKQQLDGFLDQYYTQLGGWLQQAAMWQKAAKSGEGGETFAFPSHLHHLQKSVYREVLKLCHPDVAAPAVMPYAADWVQQAMQSYAEGDGESLIALRLQLQRLSHTPEEYQQMLLQQYTMLQQEVAAAREAVTLLRSSAAWRLRQRIAHAQRTGFDLLSHIVQQLRGQGELQM